MTQVNHALRIRVSRADQQTNGGLVTVRQKTIREKILRRLLGSPVRIAVIVPGETVCAVGITEMQEGKRGEDLAAAPEPCGAGTEPETCGYGLDLDIPDSPETPEHTMTSRRKRRSETHEKV